MVLFGIFNLYCMFTALCPAQALGQGLCESGSSLTFIDLFPLSASTAECALKPGSCFMCSALKHQINLPNSQGCVEQRRQQMCSSVPSHWSL